MIYLHRSPCQWILLWILLHVCVAVEDDKSDEDRIISVDLSEGPLMSSLFTFQTHACDKDRLKIRCPYGTAIHIVSAKYGRQVSSRDMCPAMFISTFWNENPFNNTLLLPEYKKHRWKEDTNCLAKNSLEVVLQACQDQRTCSVKANVRTFGRDPCPETSKYLEVAYKCRPDEFRNKITCEGERMIIQCEKKHKIAVYTAMFGRDAKGLLECPQDPYRDGDDECYADCALEVAMRTCHGRRRCSIAADPGLYSHPCREGTRKFLSIVYACVHRRILREIDQEEGEGGPNRFCDMTSTEELEGTDMDHHPDDHLDSTPPFFWELEEDEDTFIEHDRHDNGQRDEASSSYGDNVITPVTRSADKNDGSLCIADPSGNGESCTTPDPAASRTGGSDYIGFISDWLNTVRFIQDNFEKFLLYLILGLFTGIILVLLVIVCRLLYQRRKVNRNATLDVSEPVPNSSRQTEDFTLLDQSSNNETDNIEILSINHNNRPPPFRTDTGNRSMNNYYG